MDYNPQIWPFLRITTCKNPINLNTCDKKGLHISRHTSPLTATYLSTERSHFLIRPRLLYLTRKMGYHYILKFLASFVPLFLKQNVYCGESS